MEETNVGEFYGQIDEFFGSLQQSLFVDGFLRNLLSFVIQQQVPTVTFDSSYVVLTLLSIIFSFLIFLLLYYLGKVFQAERRAALITEINQGITSLLILIIISSIFQADWYVGHYNRALDFLIRVISTIIQYQFLFTLLNTIITYIANVTIPMTFSPTQVVSLHINIYNMFAPFLAAISVLSGSLLQVLLMSYSSIFAFIFAFPKLLPILLPMAFFLRGLFFTRPAGNAILGVILGFLVIMPLTLSLSSYFYSSFLSSDIVRTKLSELGKNLMKFGIASIVYTFSGGKNWISFGFKLSAGIYGAMFLLLFLYTLTYLAVQMGMFLGYIQIPIIVFISMTAARELSRILGTEIDLSAFLKLI